MLRRAAGRLNGAAALTSSGTTHANNTGVTGLLSGGLDFVHAGSIRSDGLAVTIVPGLLLRSSFAAFRHCNTVSSFWSAVAFKRFDLVSSSCSAYVLDVQVACARSAGRGRNRRLSSGPSSQSSPEPLRSAVKIWPVQTEPEYCGYLVGVFYAQYELAAVLHAEKHILNSAI